MNLTGRSLAHMSTYGLMLGGILGGLAGIGTALILGEFQFGIFTMGLMFGGAFGASAGFLMGSLLGFLYGIIGHYLYARTDSNSYRLGLTLFGGVLAAALATRVELLQALLPFWIYTVIAGLAAAYATYRYAGWYHEQRQLGKRKAKYQADLVQRTESPLARERRLSEEAVMPDFALHTTRAQPFQPPRHR